VKGLKMAWIFAGLLYFCIGLIVAYLVTPDRKNSFDLNNKTIKNAIKWPVIIYDILVE
jgi:hypothetical protein